MNIKEREEFAVMKEKINYIEKSVDEIKDSVKEQGEILKEHVDWEIKSKYELDTKFVSRNEFNDFKKSIGKIETRLWDVIKELIPYIIFLVGMGAVLYLKGI